MKLQIVTCATLAVLANFGAAHAKSATPKAPPALYGDLNACRAIADNAARLACFDKAAAALDAAVATSEVVMVDKAQMKETRKSLFGFSLPKIGLFGGGDDGNEEEITTLETTIKSVFRTGRESWGIVLEDGARWVQIDDKIVDRPKPGATIKLRKASMGSYFANIDGARAVRMKREN